jgi:hypothetical protein
MATEEKKNDQVKKDDNTKKEVKEEENSEDEQIPKDKFAFLKKLKFLKIDEKLSDEEKKQAKLKLIIMGIGGLIVFTILIGVILFFLGVFDPPQAPVQQNVTKNKKDVKIKSAVKISSKKRKKQIKFSISQINIKRLNKKLKLLTKYEILEEDTIEKLKAVEKEKAYKKQQQDRLDKFAKNNKEEALEDDEVSNGQLVFKKVKNKKRDDDDTEEFLFKQVKNKKDKDKKNKNQDKNDKTSKTSKTMAQSKDLKAFIKIPIIKLNKFKLLIKKVKLMKVNLSICKDQNGKTQVYLGPFSTKQNRTKILKTVNKKKKEYIMNLDISSEEFEKKCKI